MNTQSPDPRGFFTINSTGKYQYRLVRGESTIIKLSAYNSVVLGSRSPDLRGGLDAVNLAERANLKV
jgi:hypothetical protein